MMAKKRVDGGPSGEDGGKFVSRQQHQQLHQPAPLHQHQLQVKVGNDHKMEKIYYLDESGDVNDDNSQKQFNTRIRACKDLRI